MENFNQENFFLLNEEPHESIASGLGNFCGVANNSNGSGNSEFSSAVHQELEGLNLTKILEILKIPQFLTRSHVQGLIEHQMSEFQNLNPSKAISGNKYEGIMQISLQSVLSSDARELLTQNFRQLV